MCVAYVKYEWHSVSRSVCGGRERGASTALAWAPCQSHRVLRCVCGLTRLCVCHDLFTCVTWLIPIRAPCMTRSCVWHDSFMRVTWLVHMCDLTHSYVWYDSFICVPWLVYMCDMSRSHVWHDSFVYVTWLAALACALHKSHGMLRCVCDMTHLFVCHDSFTFVTWLVYMCDMTSFVWRDSQHMRERAANLMACSRVYVKWLMCVCAMTHSRVWHDSIICVTRLVYTCDMTCSCVWRDSFICVTWLIHDVTRRLIHMCDMTHSWLIHMCDMTHSWLIYMCDMTHDVTRSTAWAPRQSHCMLRCVYYMTRLCVCHDLFICVTWLIPPRTTI